MALMRTKPIEDVLHQDDEGSPANQGEGRLRKRLGPFDLMGFGVGIVIGTGIFTLTGVEAKNHAGPAVIISFLVAGVVAVLAALCYAELASAVPTAGSAYTYAYTTVGEPIAWIIGWDLILEFVLGSSVVSRGWSGYLGDALHLPKSLFGESSTVNVGAMLIVLVLGVVAVVGIREASWVTNGLVLLKVAICVFVVIAGLFFVNRSNLTPFVPPAQPASAGGAGTGLARPLSQVAFGIPPTAFGFAGVLTAAAVVFFAYTGFEAVANLSEETKHPSRDMPLGLIGTLVLSTVLYVGVAFVVVGMVKYSKLDEGAPIASAFRAVGAGWAATLVSIAAVLGLSSVILVELVGIGRIAYAITRDGLLPRAIGRIHPRWGTPYRATIGMVVFVMLIAGFVPLADLADLVSIGTLFAFVLVSVAVAILRRTKPDMKRPFRVPFSPVLPILSALLCLYLATNLSVATWLRFVVWLVVGLLIYGFYGRRHARIATGRMVRDDAGTAPRLG
jgi:APA family basic amino acid/polyamine antiporter